LRPRFGLGVYEQGDLEDEQGDLEDEQGDSDDVEEGATEDPLPSMANRRTMANKKEQLGEDKKNVTGGDEKNGTQNGTRIKTVVNRVSTNIRLRVTYLTCAVDRVTVEVGG
jgi:hypothetical protein